jgi:hypothetical protein
MISRRTARRLARIIPNPLLRYAVVSVGTALVPIVLTRIGERRANRRSTALNPGAGVSI